MSFFLDKILNAEGLMYIIVKAMRDTAAAFAAAGVGETDPTPGLDTLGAALLFAAGTTVYRLVREFLTPAEA